MLTWVTSATRRSTKKRFAARLWSWRKLRNCSPKVKTDQNYLGWFEDNEKRYLDTLKCVLRANIINDDFQENTIRSSDDKYFEGRVARLAAFLNVRVSAEKSCHSRTASQVASQGDEHEHHRDLCANWDGSWNFHSRSRNDCYLRPKKQTVCH